MCVFFGAPKLCVILKFAVDTKIINQIIKFQHIVTNNQIDTQEKLLNQTGSTFPLGINTYVNIHRKICLLKDPFRL